MSKPEVRPDQIQCDSIQLSGPLQGKTLQVKVDVRPMQEWEKSRSKNNRSDWDTQEKYSDRNRREKPSEWGTVGFLFLLLFILVAAVGNGGGLGSSPSGSGVPAYNSFPSNSP